MSSSDILGAAGVFAAACGVPAATRKADQGSGCRSVSGQPLAALLFQPKHPREGGGGKLPELLAGKATASGHPIRTSETVGPDDEE